MLLQCFPGTRHGKIIGLTRQNSSEWTEWCISTRTTFIRAVLNISASDVKGRHKVVGSCVAGTLVCNNYNKNNLLLILRMLHRQMFACALQITISWYNDDKSTTVLQILINSHLITLRSGIGLGRGKCCERAEGGEWNEEGGGEGGDREERALYPPPPAPQIFFDPVLLPNKLCTPTGTPATRWHVTVNRV